MRLRDQHPSAATDLDALDGQFKRDTGLRAYIAIDGRAAGIVEYADRVREDSRLVIASLQALGVRRLLHLSGDHEHKRARDRRGGRNRRCARQHVTEPEGGGSPVAGGGWRTRADGRRRNERRPGDVSPVRYRAPTSARVRLILLPYVLYSGTGQVVVRRSARVMPLHSSRATHAAGPWPATGDGAVARVPRDANREDGMSRTKKTTNRDPNDHHGPKTQARLTEQVRGDHAAPSTLGEGPPVEGHHRLAEHRQQHDEADKNSEKNRLAREVRRGHLDRADVGDALNGDPSTGK